MSGRQNQEPRMHALRLLVLSGSQRQGSFNHQLAAAAAAHARTAGAEALEFDLRALALPVYDGDIEAREGTPASLVAWLDAISNCDAVLVVTPEYNGFPPPVLINAFDWLSRVKAAPPRLAGLAATAGKPVALMAASPGLLGGLRSMSFLRQYLQMAFGMLVLPQQYALGRAGEAFDGQGALQDPKVAAAAQAVVQALLGLAGTLQRGRGA